MRQLVINRMVGMWHRTGDSLQAEEGQDMVEYALLAALISIVAIAIILLVGPYLDNLFSDIVNALGTA